MARKVATFGIFTALMILGGSILYFISKLLPIPGSKLIVMGPYLTLILTLVINRYPRFGTISVINFVFGALMIIISPWMTFSIIVTGIISDIIMLLPIWFKVKQLLAMGVYNGMSLLTSVYIANYITGNTVFIILDPKVIIIATIIAFITGILGGYAGLKVDKIYIRPKDTINYN